MVHIEVQYHSAETPLPTKKILQKWVNTVMVNPKSDMEITLRIVDKEESYALNFQFRGKDKPTNVLSFPYDPIPELPAHIVGDIVLCAPVIKEEAAQQQKALEAHWAHMVIHGCLHLLGYDHETSEQAGVMEPMEITLLNTLGFANPYL